MIRSEAILCSWLLISCFGSIVYGWSWRTEEAGPVGLIGLALFFLAQSMIQRWWMAILFSLLAGTTAYLIACPWLAHTISYLTGADETRALYLYPFAAMLQGAHFSLFGILWHIMRKSFRWGWVTAPLIWVIVEDIWPGFFPCKTGNLLNEIPALCQIGSLGGATLVSFQAALIAGGLAQLVAFIAVGIAHRQWQMEWRVFGLGALALVASAAFGTEQLRELNRLIKRPSVEPGLRALIVQVDTDDGECGARMNEVSEQFRDKVDLLVWPECSVDNYHFEHVDFKRSTSYTDGLGSTASYPSPYPNPAATILAAGDSWLPNPDAADGKTNYVTGFLIDRQEKIVGRHRKVHLMPYGETVPGEWLFPFLRQWYGSSRRISSGPTMAPIGEVNGLKLGVMLCCEDMQPEAGRQLVNQGADLLVTLGSGAAFDSNIALRQHFRIAKLRSIENRIYFLRCTSKGVSGLISPSGKTLFELPSMCEVASPTTIPKFKVAKTCYTTFGWMASYGLGGLITLACALTLECGLGRAKV